MKVSIDKILSHVQRLRRRVRLQQVVEGLCTGLLFSFVISAVILALAKVGWILTDHVHILLLSTVLVPAFFVFYRASRPLDSIALAQRLDRSHGLYDRLSTAVSLSLKERPLTDFERAQMSDAVQSAVDIDMGRAAPWSRPSDLYAMLAAGLALGLMLVMAPPQPGELPAEPEFVITHQRVLSRAALAMEKERLEELRDRLKEANDPELAELLEELEELLELIDSQSISSREFLDRLEALEEKYFDDEAALQSDIFLERLQSAAETLEENAADEINAIDGAQDLVDAMKDGDLSAMADALTKMAENLLQDMSKEKLEDLANLFEKFADSIDFTDPTLQRLLEEQQELVEDLAKKFEESGLEMDQNLLDRAKEDLKELDQYMTDQVENEANRRLKTLERETREFSERATAQAEDAPGGEEGEEGDEGDESQQERQKSDFAQEAQRRMEDVSENLRKEEQSRQQRQTREEARQHMEEMREAMRRDRPQDQNGDGETQRDQQMKELMRRAEGREAEEGETPELLPAGSQEKDPTDEGDPTQGHRLSDIEGDEDGDGSTPGRVGTGDGGDPLGDESAARQTRGEEERVEGADGGGPSRSEIIKAASEEGFAQRSYKDVYIDYEAVVEEVMERENVPSGYRYYIKRYFDLIRPRDQ